MNLNIHHIRYAVKNVAGFSELLIHQLHFKLYAVRKLSSLEETIVLKHNGIYFVLDERRLDKACQNTVGVCSGNTVYPVDTVCDVCLNCSNIDKIIDKAYQQDGNSIKVKVTEIADESGTVQFAIVKSPVGNVQHTLVNLSNYNGPFLPGFQLATASANTSDCDKNETSKQDLLETIDHVAFALNIGQTDAIVTWYNHVMDFSRLIINVHEDTTQGFVVQEGTQGLRLKAILGPSSEFIECAQPIKTREVGIPKFVFCESLNDENPKNQVAHFVKQHKGPGAQHIAFNTVDIVQAVAEFKKCGLNCVLPPETYYQEESKYIEIAQLNYEIETLMHNNILLESYLNNRSPKENCDLIAPSFNYHESKPEDQIKQMMSTHWFIMQVFTSPVFKEKTLFFEIIQRFQTLSGFGAGNIGALWKAVQNELFSKQSVTTEVV